MASCIEVVPNARLFMRSIQLDVLTFWKASTASLDQTISCTPDLKSHMRWWLQTQNTLKGRSLVHVIQYVTITTEASKTGWGSLMNKEIVQGIWTEVQSLEHINYLELEAVFLTIKHVLLFLKNKNLLIRIVVQYINKQKGTNSIQLCTRTWDLWNLALQNHMTLEAAHIAGSQNVLEDHLSRVQIYPTEWSLNNTIV